MIDAFNTLVVGLGSTYGDDQLGWRLVDAVKTRHPLRLEVRYVRSALELLDLISEVERLVICDACQGVGPIGSWHRWRWPAADLNPLRSYGSHDLGLAAVLTLADTLGQLPREVTIWAIEVKSTIGAYVRPDASLSAEVEEAMPLVSALISEELNHARTVVG